MKTWPTYKIKFYWIIDGIRDGFAQSYTAYSLEKVFEKCIELQDTCGAHKGVPKDVCTAEVTYIGERGFFLTWFSHYTFPEGRSDQEILDDFREYVNQGSGESLMGAEDSWRWKLCRCEHCVAQGIVRIDH